MNRRDLLKAIATIPFAGLFSSNLVSAWSGTRATNPSRSRVRLGDPGWPSADAWDDLRRAVGGRLIKVRSPLAACDGSADCASSVLHGLKNPFYVGDQPGLTQTSGWVGAWTSQPSVYAVAAERTADIVAAVDFAREHHLRLVVKGGGHSYQGRSDAPDSLLVWTRRMNDVTLYDAFVGEGCEGKQTPQPAVTIGAGAMWIDAYNAVTTKAGRYVQGGGCTTVGVAGLVQSGGFGSFSKRFGTAAAGLLEAEIVTADGKVRIANVCTNPDLFWGIKGGGGGSLGVVTRLTLRTRELPRWFGAVFGRITASSDAAYRELIAKTVAFYHEQLFNPHWGEQIRFHSDNTVEFSLVFQGLDQQQVQALWDPYRRWVAGRPKDFVIEAPVQIVALPARHFWDIDFLSKHAPGVAVADGRPGVPKYHYFWAGDQGQVGQFVYSYKSAWLPTSLLQKDRQAQFVDAVFTGTRHWGFELHFNKGLAGAPADEIAAAKDTATNPDVLDAFALAITGAEGPPAYPGIPGHEPDLAAANRASAAIGKAMGELLKVAPDAGSYFSESDFFEKSWQQSFWGTNYRRLAAAKQKYDPDGLFFIHHGVGSEAWRDDGFTRIDEG